MTTTIIRLEDELNARVAEERHASSVSRRNEIDREAAKKDHAIR